MLTALPLYFSQVESIVGRRLLVAQIHTWSGVALPVPLIISLAGPWGVALRRDFKRFSLWSTDELHWLLTRGKYRLRESGKFNPGQKLNAIFIGGAIVVMLATGSILKWFDLFPLSWRTGATLVHDVFALAIFVVVFGHIGMALTHRDALRSMFKGWVPEKWARQHAPGWLNEIEQAKAISSPSDSILTK
jgi:formate dehydrogenase subunit gamma